MNKKLKRSCTCFKTKTDICCETEDTLIPQNPKHSFITHSEGEGSRQVIFIFMQITLMHMSLATFLKVPFSRAKLRLSNRRQTLWATVWWPCRPDNRLLLAVSSSYSSNVFTRLLFFIKKVKIKSDKWKTQKWKHRY